MNTVTRIFVRDLNANDVFRFPGSDEKHVCVSRYTEGHSTRLLYRAYGRPANFADYSEIVRVNMSTVDLLS